jgi:GDPmannose 4,6-dehydratase
LQQIIAGRTLPDTAHRGATTLGTRRTLGSAITNRALVTGINGQDGSYLAELLLEKGYEVHGVIRRASSFNTSRIDHLYEDPHAGSPQLILHHGDLTDGSQLGRLIRTVEPDEIYNLAAQSHVAVSFQQPEYTGNVDGLGVVRLLEAIRESGVDTRLYQAGTSEMFGNAPPPQSEATSFRPRSPYGAAKLFAYWMVDNYREAYDMYAVTGILFNHESPRRGETFVTRKITRALARIIAGTERTLYLGNLDARRDWGHAKDHVRAMWMMLQQKTPADYVIGTGEDRSVKEFLDAAFSHVGLDWEPYVTIDPLYFRPTEVETLRADSSQAESELGWKPEYTFAELVDEMVVSDLADLALTLDEARARATILSG